MAKTTRRENTEEEKDDEPNVQISDSEQEGSRAKESPESTRFYIYICVCGICV